MADALEPAKPISFESKAEQILVPYCPESVLSGIQRPQEINMWYRRSFVVPSGWKNKQVIIHFDAVAHHTTLVVNGHKAGAHAGSYDAFSFDITQYLINGENTLIVAVQDPNDGRVPSRKTVPAVTILFVPEYGEQPFKIIGDHDWSWKGYCGSL